MKIQIASDLHLEFLEQRFQDYRVDPPACLANASLTFLV